MERRQLIIIDAPGHGVSSAPARFTLEQCATVANEIFDAISITEPVDWVGNAWGGHTGLVYAARHPERVRTLTTIATLLPQVSGLLRMQMHALLTTHRLLGMQKFMIGPMLNTLLSSHTQSTDDEAVHYIKTCIGSMAPQAFQSTMASIMLDRPDLTDICRSLTVPTLLMTGAEDQLCTSEDINQTAGNQPWLTATTIPRAAHITALEAPAETSSAILNFWRQYE